MLHSVLINKDDFHFCVILKKYINNINLNENIFKSAKNKFIEYLEKK